MLIPGYLDGSNPPLVDAMSWVDDELFWPAFLSGGSGEVFAEAFDVDLVDLGIYYENFEQPDIWPVFTVPVGGGTFRLIWANFPDDETIDWLLDAPLCAELDRIADEEGGYLAGAALPWRLLPRDPVHLLLALCAFDKRGVPDEGPSQVAQALRAVGAVGRLDTCVNILMEGTLQL